MGRLRQAWRNAYYRITLAYVAAIVTAMFGFQLYQYFSTHTKNVASCDRASALTLVPVIGVFFDG